MNEKVIKLPEQEEMLQRLLNVSDSAHYRENFYPILLKEAGQELVAEGVVTMLVLAIHDYTKRLPAMMIGVLNTQVPLFIKALVDDQEVTEKAIAFFNEVQC